MPKLLQQIWSFVTEWEITVKYWELELTLRHRNGRDLGGQEGVLILFKSNKLKSLRLLRQKKNDWIFLEYLSHGLAKIFRKTYYRGLMPASIQFDWAWILIPGGGPGKGAVQLSVCSDHYLVYWTACLLSPLTSANNSCHNQAQIIHEWK